MRKAEPIGYRVIALETTGLAEDPAAWVEKQPDMGENRWFLAHADDGVIWGQNRGGHLSLSSAIFPVVSPVLRAVTLQQARLFSEQAEVRLWRNGSDFTACRIEDFTDSSAEAFDEEYLLWGNKVNEQKDGFTLMADGIQGLLHAVPLEIAGPIWKGHRHFLRLIIRHYLEHNEDGQVKISLSRLVTLRCQGGL